MKKIRTLGIAFLIVFASGALQAQIGSPVGLGVRLNPDGAGITGKFFFDRNFALEAQLNASGGFYGAPDDGPSVALAGLLEYHIILPDPSWRIFLGPGVHFGSWNRYVNHYGDIYYPAQAIFGIDGILGLEYVFKTVPIGISADVKPAINFATDVAYFPNNMFGLSVRYYLGHKMHNSTHPAATQQER